MGKSNEKTKLVSRHKRFGAFSDTDRHKVHERGSEDDVGYGIEEGRRADLPCLLSDEFERLTGPLVPDLAAALRETGLTVRHVASIRDDQNETSVATTKEMETTKLTNQLLD